MNEPRGDARPDDVEDTAFSVTAESSGPSAASGSVAQNDANRAPHSIGTPVSAEPETATLDSDAPGTGDADPPGSGVAPALSAPPRRRRLIRRSSFPIGDIDVTAGRSAIGEIPISRLVTGNQISIPINVVHGRHDGPVVWLSAAVHGDEIGGVEIIRRSLAAIDPKTLAGTIVAVPIVNVHGFLNGDRYLPDRRDLNRSFPGSANGSLAARIANLFITEIVERCDVGIDLHTGSDHRTNLPQIRADLDDPHTRDLAIAFGAPLMMHAKLRDGSMRAAATATGSTVLLYEGGEAWRFDRQAIEAGVVGVGRVLERLAMTTPADDPAGGASPMATTPMPVESRSSGWVRVRRSGIALIDVTLGQYVERGQVIATVRDSVGRRLSRTRASRSGMVIGHTQQPLVNQGDAIIHIAEIVPRSDSAHPTERAASTSSARRQPPDTLGTDALPSATRSSTAIRPSSPSGLRAGTDPADGPFPSAPENP